MNKRSVCLFSVSILLIAVIAVMSITFFGSGESFSFWEADSIGKTETSSDQVYFLTKKDSSSGTSVPSGSVDRGSYNPCLKYLDFTLHNGNDTIDLMNYSRSFSDGILTFDTTSSGATLTLQDGAYVEITGYRGNISALYIPSKIKINNTDVSVTAISGITSTSSTSAITVIEIPSTITSIGRGCFSGLKLTRLAFVGDCGQELNIGARAFARSVTSDTEVWIAGTKKKSLPSNFKCGANAFAGWN